MDDLRHGPGVYHYANGDRFEGTWENGKREGKGRYLYKFGGYFDGTWNNDSALGEGWFTDHTGRQYVGVWQEKSKRKRLLALDEQWVGSKVNAFDAVQTTEYGV